jgi:hypothetical protein
MEGPTGGNYGKRVGYAMIATTTGYILLGIGIMVVVILIVAFDKIIGAIEDVIGWFIGGGNKSTPRRK